MTNSSMGFNENKNSGGGYIDQLSVAKSRAIKLPLNLNREWNEGVNRCESYEELFFFIGQSDNSRMASGGEITDSIVWHNGEIIDDWASDVGGSNESRDNVIEYNGKHYLVVTNFDQYMLLTPNKNSQIWEDDYAKGGGEVSKEDNFNGVF